MTIDIDNCTLDELKELKRQITQKLRQTDSIQTRTKVATLKHTDQGTYHHRKEWRVIITPIKLGYCIGNGARTNTAVIRGETREQTVNALEDLIEELKELYALATTEVRNEE